MRLRDITHDSCSWPLMGELSFAPPAVTVPETSCVFVNCFLPGRYFVLPAAPLIIYVIMKIIYPVRATLRWGTMCWAPGRGWIWSSPSHKKLAVWWGVQRNRKAAALRVGWEGDGCWRRACGNTGGVYSYWSVEREEGRLPRRREHQTKSPPSSKLQLDNETLLIGG